MSIVVLSDKSDGASGSYGSRQGSPLHSHRSSRDSGDDLWADRPLDIDPLRVAHPGRA